MKLGNFFLRFASSAMLTAILHFVPNLLPLLSPGKRTAADDANLLGQIFFLNGFTHPAYFLANKSSTRLKLSWLCADCSEPAMSIFSCLVR